MKDIFQIIGIVVLFICLAVGGYYIAYRPQWIKAKTEIQQKDLLEVRNAYDKFGMYDWSI